MEEGLAADLTGMLVSSVMHCRHVVTEMLRQAEVFMTEFTTHHIVVRLKLNREKKLSIDCYFFTFDNMFLVKHIHLHFIFSFLKICS